MDHEHLPREPGGRSEDRPVDPDAVARLERLGATSRPADAAPLVRPRAPRSNLVTTAGAILLVLGLFVGAVAILFIAPGEGMELQGATVSASTAMVLFLALAALYLLTGALVLVRHPVGRPLGMLIGALGLVIGVAQLSSAGLNAIPTVVVGAFVIYALAVAGAEFRRG
jgi:hypothetical protein